MFKKIYKLGNMGRGAYYSEYGMYFNVASSSHQTLTLIFSKWVISEIMYSGSKVLKCGA